MRASSCGRASSCSPTSPPTAPTCVCTTGRTLSSTARNSCCSARAASAWARPSPTAATTRSPTRWASGLAVVGGDALDFVLRAEHHRDALVQLLRLDVEDSGLAVRGLAARLLDDEGHRVRLVHQAQAAILVL